MNLYKNKYHEFDIKKFNFLVTGGAGFIGSNIVEYLLNHGANKVRVLDNLSTGSIENIKRFDNYSNFEFLKGDINDLNTCFEATKEIHFVTHQAALGSVPRSIKNPIQTNLVNISGFLNMLEASKENESIIKFVYAASSSTYGDSKFLPKVEGQEGRPLSPYAITKVVNELYAEVFSKIYNFNTIGLRYFNVFGPWQNPNNAYAAVIPIFCKNFIQNTIPEINGDGKTSRDFTFVENVVQANIKSFNLGFYNNKNENNTHQVFNVGCGFQTSLNQILEMLNDITGKDLKPIYLEERSGDIKHSLASIEKIKNIINYNPLYNFKDGLEVTFKWYLESNYF
jgi:UDP-N-acetylglucosamine 4-epimerase